MSLLETSKMLVTQTQLKIRYKIPSLTFVLVKFRNMARVFVEVRSFFLVEVPTETVNSL